jgi:hypothetical protein
MRGFLSGVAEDAVLGCETTSMGKQIPRFRGIWRWFLLRISSLECDDTTLSRNVGIRLIIHCRNVVAQKNRFFNNGTFGSKKVRKILARWGTVSCSRSTLPHAVSIVWLTEWKIYLSSHRNMRATMNAYKIFVGNFFKLRSIWVGNIKEDTEDWMWI